MTLIFNKCQNFATLSCPVIPMLPGWIITRQPGMKKQGLHEESGFENLAYDLDFLDKWAWPQSSKIILNWDTI